VDDIIMLLKIRSVDEVSVPLPRYIV